MRTGAETHRHSGHSTEWREPVYRNGRVIGFVREHRCGQHEAVLIDGQSMGLYTSANAAFSAVLEALGGADCRMMRS